MIPGFDHPSVHQLAVGGSLALGRSTIGSVQPSEGLVAGQEEVSWSMNSGHASTGDIITVINSRG